MSQATPNFNGLRVAALETRRGAMMAQLIDRLGGRPFVSASMLAVPLTENRSAIDFAHRLITGEVGVVILQTGIGFQRLIEIVRHHLDAQRLLDALNDVTTVARGPKVERAMKEAGVTPTLVAAPPGTWREVLIALDQSLSVDHRTVAVQEYGQPNASLIAGLEARGARVLPVSLYRWQLPNDISELRQNIEAIVAGLRDVVLFTSAHQLTSLLQVAAEMGVERRLADAATACVIGSIGPVTSEALRRAGWPVDLQPELARMGHLVRLAASRSRDILDRKQQIHLAVEHAWEGTPDMQAPWYDSPFMKAARGEPTDVTPVWLMRQAGRYMAEYREVRSKVSFLELCKDPALCSEVMCTAVARLGVDAAIVFSDLLPILEPMGFDLEFAKGAGPVIHNPVREAQDLDRILELEGGESLHFVMEAIRQTRNDLPAALPLIGFAGAPFTLASYAIEGGASRNYLHTKTLMYRDAGAWHELMGRLSRAVIQYLNGQIAAGAQAVQLFDSWVGCLGPDDYRQFVMPHVAEIVRGITPGIPVINFATGNPALVPLLAEAGSAVVGVDWRIRLDDAWNAIGHDRAIQGNLEPCTLLADIPTIREQAKKVLQMAGGRPGHIFNLGHGVLQQTPVDHAIALVDAVHEFSQR